MNGTDLHIPTLVTTRLTLRAPKASDFPSYAAFCGSERSKGVGGPYSEGEAFQRLAGLVGQWHLRGYGRWMVADRETDAPLGVVGILHPVEWPEPEIAWSVFEEAEGRGIAHEAALASRRYAYEALGWPTIISCTTPDNHRSIRLAQRMGARADGAFEHPAFGKLLIWRHPSAEEVAA